MPLGLQSKLLNVIEERKIRRVGGVDSIPVDVRIICATNADLNALVKEKKFREDLYYRLSVFTIKMLPLRETKEDIIPLAEFFLDKLNKTKGTQKFLSEATQRSMLMHNWPGNIRELRNVVERIYVISYTDALDFVPTPTFGIPTGLYDADKVISTKNYDSLKDYVNEAEKLFIDKTIEECRGSMSEAARRLKIDRSSLYKKYKKLSEK
ncbi:MAG: sigma-54-dependent Fis family transcriptional regulator [Firmicutes bacterium]|nr:sigma-54-dependent Fis family transcriptional regulator [Bacillota bacterium]